MIPYGRQSISEKDIAAVVAVLKSDYLTQGPAVPAFEAALADYCGVDHAVAVNSATSALHIACLALGVRPGDWVWTSPITFVASSNSALYCGATVDFVDIDPATYNMGVDALATKLEQAARRDALPKVVIPVHMAGQSCDMKGISELAGRYGFKVIEDASHAIGARYRGSPVGDCRYSDVTVFSFHPVKIITTAEGGAALTRDGAIAARMAMLRTHGVTRDAGRMTRADQGGWHYEQHALGFNYRMTDIQAALGLSQMDRLDGFVARRRELAARYDSALASEALTRPWQAPETESSYHLYIVRLALERNSVSRRSVYDQLRQDGIGVNVHYIPVYLQPFYRELGFSPGHCPEAERYYEAAISIPLFADLEEADQDYVIDRLRAAVEM